MRVDVCELLEKVRAADFDHFQTEKKGFAKMIVWNVWSENEHGVLCAYALQLVAHPVVQSRDNLAEQFDVVLRRSKKVQLECKVLCSI